VNQRFHVRGANHEQTSSHRCSVVDIVFVKCGRSNSQSDTAKTNEVLPPRTKVSKVRDVVGIFGCKARSSSNSNAVCALLLPYVHVVVVVVVVVVDNVHRRKGESGS